MHLHTQKNKFRLVTNRYFLAYLVIKIEDEERKKANPLNSHPSRYDYLSVFYYSKFRIKVIYFKFLTLVISSLFLENYAFSLQK